MPLGNMVSHNVMLSLTFRRRNIHRVFESLTVWCRGWAYTMLIYVLFVSSTSGIVFNLRIDAVTHDSQSAKDICPHVKSQPDFEFPQMKPVLISLD